MCRVIVETPVNLSKKQKDILRSFQETLGESGDKKHGPKQHSWFEGVRSFFDDMKL
jgi:molecular chaperone DnaJ